MNHEAVLSGPTVLLPEIGPEATDPYAAEPSRTPAPPATSARAWCRR